jgi:anti-sigma regulatory factor (Ser/Thr protein kinase)
VRGARSVAALAVPLLLALGACSEEDRDRAVDDAVGEARDRASSALEEADLPSVDWQKLRDGAKEEIDEAAAAADCEKLTEELGQIGTRNSEVRDYIEVRMREAGC